MFWGQKINFGLKRSKRDSQWSQMIKNLYLTGLLVHNVPKVINIVAVTTKNMKKVAKNEEK